MSTNYYARIIPTAKNYNDLRSLVMNGPIERAIRYIDRLEDKIHIGKSSAGWQFTFNYNKGKYYENIEQLKEFLKSVEIVNEYKEIIDYEIFWDIVNNRTWGGQPGKRVKDYYSDGSYGYQQIDGYEFLNTEFS